jgi:hypothetical protein
MTQRTQAQRTADDKLDREIDTDFNTTEIVRRLTTWAAITSQGAVAIHRQHIGPHGHIYDVLHDAAATIEELRSRLSGIVMFSYDEFAKLDDLLYNGRHQNWAHTLEAMVIANRGFHADSRTKPTLTAPEAGRWAQASDEALHEIDRLRRIITLLHLHLVDKHDTED